MSIYQDSMDRLSTLISVFGFDPMKIEQGSIEWHIMKLGVLSASNADKIVAKRDSMGRKTYMANLISQICTCKLPDELPFKQLEHGKMYEPEAREALSVAMGFIDIQELPFIYADDNLRYGNSPDGVHENTVFEIKAPYNGENFFKFACFDDNKKTWRWQSQFQIFSASAERHIFAQYEPRSVLANSLHYIETDINESDQKTLADAIPQFISDMDKALNSIGVTFGQHWEYLKNKQEAK